MFDLKNKKGIIFGATGYIGQKLSYELSKMGCKLILHGNSIERLKELDNVFLLPHMSSATIEGRIEMGEKVIINIKTFSDGHTPPDIILNS